MEAYPVKPLSLRRRIIWTGFYEPAESCFCDMGGLKNDRTALEFGCKNDKNNPDFGWKNDKNSIILCCNIQKMSIFAFQK